VPKSEYASQNWYDVWFPNLAPSPETIKIGQSAKTEDEWKAFLRKYKAEMATPENSRTLDLLASLSHESNFSVGCYCADERRCHRSELRALLLERGAKVQKKKGTVLFLERKAQETSGLISPKIN
jgi:uncharacterized protein YeaO (DUF488 family)